VLFFGISVAVIVSQMSMTNSLGIALGIAMFIVAFFRTDIALYLLILSMLLSPEIGFGGLQEEGVATERTIAIRLDDLFMMLLSFGWLARSAINKNLGLITKSPINGKIYIYTASFVLSTGAGILYGDVKTLFGFFNVVKFIQYFLLYFMVMNYIENEKQARRLVYAALLTAFIISAYALAQIPSGNRVTAPFEGAGGEPNTLGGYLLLLLSITLGLGLQTTHFFKRLGYAFLAILELVSLFYTESRSSYVGLALAVIILVFYSKRRNILLLGVVVTMIFSSMMIPSRVIERINYTFKSEEIPPNPFSNPEALEKIDSSTRARIMTWTSAFKAWKKYPIMGWGVGGLKFLDGQYVKILAETGAVGLFTFLMLLGSIYKNLHKIAHFVHPKDEFYSGLTIGLLAGFVGLWGHAVGTNTFIIIRIMEPFWLFMGIVMSIPRFLPETQAPPVETREVVFSNHKW
jgi:O-antigen ligase